jgi:hypothetical protein
MQCGASYYILSSKKDQINQRDIRGACSKHSRNEKYINIQFGRTQGKYQFHRLDISWREILKWIEKKHSDKGNPVFTCLTTKSTGGLE